MDNKTISNIKLQTIGLDQNFTGLSDEQIDIIYNKITQLNNRQHDSPKKIINNTDTDNKGSEFNSDKVTKKTKNTGVYIRNPKNIKIDKNSDKYKITLEFLNALVIAIGKPAINNITQFKDILRSDLMKPQCENVLNEHIGKIIEIFGKSVIRYNTRSKSKCYLLTVIKYLSSLCGYKFQSKNVHNKSKKNNIYVATLHTYYSICDQ